MSTGLQGGLVAVKPPVIAGKYTLLRRLGHGGMAEVFLAKQSGDGGFEKLVVLKRILPHLSQGQEFTTMVLDEARVAADLRHPNIVSAEDIYMPSDICPATHAGRAQSPPAAARPHDLFVRMPYYPADLA